MKLHDLKPAPGSTKERTRVGRGISAGKGKTAGRGMNGQGSRSGGKKPPYFEGGQNPLVRRLPFKRGFTNLFRIEYQEINVGDLEEFEAGTHITPALLVEHGLIREALRPVVILGGGDVKKSMKYTIDAHRFSKSAQEKLDAAGCKTNKLEIKVKGAFATVKLLPKEELAKLYNAE
jgi:large subunit ribosomal protein L15